MDELHKSEQFTPSDDGMELAQFGSRAATPAPACACGRLISLDGASGCFVVDGPEGSDGSKAFRVGHLVKLPAQTRWAICTIRRVARSSDGLVVDFDILGEAEQAGPVLGTFQRGLTAYPDLGDPVVALTDAERQALFAPTGSLRIEIGTVYPTRDVRASLMADAMLARHFAILGSTGTGKSTATALLLHRIIDKAPQAHVLMLDPHGEYAAAFGRKANLLDVTSLELPFWLMTFEEHVELIIGPGRASRSDDLDILARCLLQARTKSRAGNGLAKVTVDSPVPYLMSDLLAALNEGLGKLDKPEKAAPFLRLKTRLEELKNDPRYSFMFSGMLVSDRFASVLATLFRMPGDGQPLTVIDLSGVPADIVSIVVSVISRLAMDLAVWTPPEERRPILLVCEEAHRYVPNERLDRSGSARRILERIAKEGRKYGVSLGLVSQRPSDLSESVLSQCGTIISMRLNNERDQDYVRDAMPEGAEAFLSALPALRNRECIICGEGVMIPVRVKLDELEADLRPSSDDPCFSELWARDDQYRDIIASAINRWRNRGH